MSSRFKADGVLITSGPQGTLEQHTMMCGHHNGIVRLKPGETPDDKGGVCKQCMRFVCMRCYRRVGCTPFEKVLERYEARAAARRSYDLACR